MRTVHVDRKDSALDDEGGVLTVRVRGERIAVLPLAPIERLVVHGRVTLGSRLLASLWRQGSGLLLLSGRRSEPTARFAIEAHGDARIRLAQYALTLDPVRRMAIARGLIRGKIDGQRRLLARALEARPDRRHALIDALARLDEAAIGMVRQPPADRDTLLGREGSASAAFLQGYIALFPEAFGFTHRNRRPPRDPINACLSLGYTILHHEAVRACAVAGLDPLLGVLHEPVPNRESLASDLVEPLRAHVDEIVWRLVAARDLRPEHFTRDGEACLIGKAGRERLYAGFDAPMAALGRLLCRMAAGLVRQLREGERP